MTARTQVNHLGAFHQAKTLAGFHKHSVVGYYRGQNRLGTLCQLSRDHFAKTG